VGLRVRRTWRFEGLVPAEQREESRAGRGGGDGHEEPGAVVVALARERAASGDRDERGEPERGSDLPEGGLDGDAGG
jgi:hypothetical protein